MNKTIIKNTPFGPLAILWASINGRPRVTRVIIPQPSLSAEKQVKESFPEAKVATCSEIDAVCADMLLALNGKNICFALDLVHLDLCPPFQQAVLREEHRVSRGCVNTYQLLAVRLGKPSASRAVGNALAKNPFPIIVPCHRTIRSDGTLGGYQGGLEMKRALLAGEGVRFDAQGRVLSGPL